MNGPHGIPLEELGMFQAEAEEKPSTMRRLLEIGEDAQEGDMFYDWKDSEWCDVTRFEKISAMSSPHYRNEPDCRAEMLETLEVLLSIHQCADETGYVDGEGFVDADKVEEMIRAAIAKAKGVQP